MLRLRLFRALPGALAMLLFAASAAATPIAIFNTGVDAFGNVLPHGTVGDPHYSLISVPGGSTTTLIITSAGGFPVPPYIGDNTLSRWIGPGNDGDLNGPAGTYVYRTTFDLTGLNPATASLLIGWSTDNNGLDVALNGASLGQTTSFTQFSAGFSVFAVTSGFLPGVNTLDFWVNNGSGPTALRVEAAGTADPIPEPGSLLLLGAGLAALGLLRARRRGN
jgi:hypothetical protein